MTLDPWVLDAVECDLIGPLTLTSTIWQSCIIKSCVQLLVKGYYSLSCVKNNGRNVVLCQLIPRASQKFKTSINNHQTSKAGIQIHSLLPFFIFSNYYLYKRCAIGELSIWGIIMIWLYNTTRSSSKLRQETKSIFHVIIHLFIFLLRRVHLSFSLLYPNVQSTIQFIMNINYHLQDQLFDCQEFSSSFVFWKSNVE